LTLIFKHSSPMAKGISLQREHLQWGLADYGRDQHYGDGRILRTGGRDWLQGGRGMAADVEPSNRGRITDNQVTWTPDGAQNPRGDVFIAELK
jgi:hypothetical protein